MIVVEGKKAREIDAAGLRALIASYVAVSIDLGTGDGRFAYRYAASHPDRFVIGIDPVAEAMAEMSGRARRKQERGGVTNVRYAVASIERIPPELDHIANEIFVNLPWGSLMRGIILADDRVIEAIARLANPGAIVRIILNTRIFDDPIPLEARDLPDVTPGHLRLTLTPKFAYHRIAIDVMQALSSVEPHTVVVNVRNNGAIEDLPDHDIVEVPCSIDRNGAVPHKTGRLPEPVRGLVESVKAYEHTAIRAAVEGSATLAKLAMLEYPVVGDWELAGRLLESLARADPEFLGHLK